MKRLLLPLLAVLALPTAVNAGVDPEVHKLCKDVTDYMGCIETNKNKNSFEIKNIFSRNIKKEKFFNSEDKKKVEKWKKENFDPSKQPFTGYAFEFTDDNSGIYVIQVFSSGAAHKAGLKKLSLITSIDNERISNQDPDEIAVLVNKGTKISGIYNGKSFTKTLKEFNLLDKKGMKEFDYFIAQFLRLEDGMEGNIELFIPKKLQGNMQNLLLDWAERRSDYLYSKNQNLFFNEFFNKDDLKKLKEHKNNMSSWKKNLFFNYGYGFIISTLDQKKTYVAFTEGPAKKAGIKVGDQLLSVDNFEFVDDGEGLFYDPKEKSTLKIHEYIANNDSVNFKLKRNNKIIKVKLYREKYSDDQIKKIEYFIAQALRFRNFSEFDKEILFPNTLKKASINLRKEYEIAKNSDALNSLPISITSQQWRRQPFIIEKPCPKDLKGWGCWGYQTMKRFINGTAISYCGVANGALPKEDFWSFAVEHAKNKFPSKSRNKARQDIVELYYSDRFIVQKSAKNLIKKADGCAYLLKDNYPSFYRENTVDNSNAPTLQETMQDTPFEW